MGMYRTSRPIIVDARQCKKTETIATDLGFINLKQGEWIIRGEGGECYIVDDAFFQRTFISVQERPQTLETKGSDCQGRAKRSKRSLFQNLPLPSFHPFQGRRTCRALPRRKDPDS